MSVCGPHIDGENPRNWEDAVVARSPEQSWPTRNGNSAKARMQSKSTIAFLSESVKSVVRVCRRHKARSTAHLEILDAREAMRAGVEGFEHITSLGQSVVPRKRAEQYRQSVLKDNAARRPGRYQLFAEVDFGGGEARKLFDLIRRHRPFYRSDPGRVRAAPRITESASEIAINPRIPEHEEN